MTALNEYSFKGCMFECMLDLAQQECGCVPWNYPRLQDGQGTRNQPLGMLSVRLLSSLSDPETELCDFFWSTCFELALNNNSRRIGQCKPICLPDCDGVFFETDVSSEALTEDTLPL